MPNFIYGNVVLADNKTDGGSITNVTKVVAGEWNTSVDALYDTKAAITLGQYHGLADQSSAPPAVSAAGDVRQYSDAGDWLISANGGPYWNPLTAINVLAYGADPSGVADSTTAFNLALTAWKDGRGFGGYLYLPAGDYKISSTLITPSVLGGLILGSGKQTTRLLWTGAAGIDFLQVLGSQHTTLQGFSMWGLSTAQPRYMVNYSYGAGALHAATGNSMRDVLITGDQVTGNYETGVFLDNAFGNNSEMLFDNVTVERYSDTAWYMPGSQQKAITFVSCGANGGWDGADHTAVGAGQFGIRTAGNFGWYGGGVSGNRTAAFTITAPNDPILIWNCDCEGNYRWFDGGGTASTSASCALIQGNRVSCDAADHAADFIRISGDGPSVVEGNMVESAVNPLPYILVSPQNSNVASRFQNNYFQSEHNGGSCTQAGVVVNTSGQLIAYPDTRANLYKDGSGSKFLMPEWLTLYGDGPYYPGTFSTGVSYLNVWQDSPVRGRITLSIAKEAFTAAALTQTIDLFPGGLPKGMIVRRACLLMNGTYVGPGFSSMLGRIGLSSGGQELLLDQDLFFAGVPYFGAIQSQLGTAWFDTTAQAGIMLATYQTHGHLYYTLTANTNLGTGSVTNLTSGQAFIQLDLEMTQRFVYGA